MKTAKLTDFTNGWFLGNFEPSLMKTDFEVGLQIHERGEFHRDHFHKLYTEFNLIVEGTLIINGQQFSEGDIFVLYPYEISQVEYLTDVKILVARNGSDPNDKYEVIVK